MQIHWRDTGIFDVGKLQKIPENLKKNFIDSELLPHIHLRIAHAGETALDAIIGNARENGTPLQQDALYRVASMTKPITSLAFMMLQEQGLVSLDTAVTDILPEFSGIKVFAGQEADGSFRTRPLDAPMRMIDLLRHTSGLTYSFQNSTPIDALYAEKQLDVFHQKRDTHEWATEVARLPLEFSPGAAWRYSVSTDMLGIVIERLTGLSLAQYFEQNIFTPLGMVDSFFVVPPAKLPRLTDAWMLNPQGRMTLYDRGQNSRWRMTPASYSGGGGLISSTSDYMRFAQMLLNGGALEGVRLVSADTVALMTSNHLPENTGLTHMARSSFSETDFLGLGFGLGFSVAMDPSCNPTPMSKGEYRWAGLLSTSFCVDPAENLTIVQMSQLMPSSATNIRQYLNQLIHDALRPDR